MLEVNSVNVLNNFTVEMDLNIRTITIEGLLARYCKSLPGIDTAELSLNMVSFCKYHSADLGIASGVYSRLSLVSMLSGVTLYLLHMAQGSH